MSKQTLNEHTVSLKTKKGVNVVFRMWNLTLGVKLQPIWAACTMAHRMVSSRVTSL